MIKNHNEHSDVNSSSFKNFLPLIVLLLLLVPMLLLIASRNFGYQSKAAGNVCEPQVRDSIEMAIVSYQNQVNALSQCKMKIQKCEALEAKTGDTTDACIKTRNECAELPNLQAKLREAQEQLKQCGEPVPTTISSAQCSRACNADEKCITTASKESTFTGCVPVRCLDKNGGLATENSYCDPQNNLLSCDIHPRGGRETTNCPTSGQVCLDNNNGQAQCGVRAQAFDCRVMSGEGKVGDDLCASDSYSDGYCIADEAMLNQIPANEKGDYKVGMCKFSQFDCRRLDAKHRTPDSNCPVGDTTSCNLSTGQCTGRLGSEADTKTRTLINKGSNEEIEARCPNNEPVQRACGDGGVQVCKWHLVTTDKGWSRCDVINCGPCAL